MVRVKCGQGGEVLPLVFHIDPVLQTALGPDFPGLLANSDLSTGLARVTPLPYLSLPSCHGKGLPAIFKAPSSRGFGKLQKVILIRMAKYHSAMAVL